MSEPAPTAWPAHGLEDLGRCPVCGVAERVTLHEGLTDRAFGVAPGRWSMRRCLGCGSGYLDPRPSPGTIELAYRSYHTHAAPSLERPRGRLVRTGDALVSGYANARLGYARRPALAAGRLVVPLVPGGPGWAFRGVRCLPRIAGGRLLDVGCGNGQFLLEMRPDGWEVRGIDPDPAAVAFARDAGLDVTEDTLESARLAPGSFDAITLSHVIEHVHDPPETLRACLDLLRPGGLLWIATPNLLAGGHRRFGPDWFPLDPPRHLTLFTRASLHAALERAGLEPAPDPPWVPDATLWSDRASSAVRRGRDPYHPPPLSRRDLLRALAADARSRIRRTSEEELDVLARRPGA
jgi:2-polyprenyl-3-methyl-5-hydroxy-6-metoxy-1,4-benzoquinol methylase